VSPGALPGANTARTIANSIRERCTPEDVLNELSELPNPRTVDEGDLSSYNPLKIDVFVQTLLQLGMKSFSHSFAAISKFHYVFKVLAESEEAQICVLRSMFELWHNHQQVCLKCDDLY
jgi:nuclear cap-binding protein subunit 1